MSDQLDPMQSPNGKNIGKKSFNKNPLIFLSAMIVLIIISFVTVVASSSNSEGLVKLENEVKTILSAPAPELKHAEPPHIVAPKTVATADEKEESSEHERPAVSTPRPQNQVYSASPVQRQPSQKDEIENLKNELFKNALKSVAQENSNNIAQNVEVKKSSKGVHERSGSLYLMAGGVISCVLETGINSDLPGMIIGRVTRDVYDTKTGDFVLIPAGTKVLGSYNEALAVGQERLLLKWNRLIYPDATSVDLGEMGGHDTEGYAGLTGEVDNHYGKIFGSAILLSLVSAGYRESQPAGSNNPTSGDVLAAEIGKTFHQVSAQMIQQQMQIKPTVKVTPGSKFTILVNNDLGLNAWKW